MTDGHAGGSPSLLVVPVSRPSHSLAGPGALARTSSSLSVRVRASPSLTVIGTVSGVPGITSVTVPGDWQCHCHHILARPRAGRHGHGLQVVQTVQVEQPSQALAT